MATKLIIKGARPVAPKAGLRLFVLKSVTAKWPATTGVAALTPTNLSDVNFRIRCFTDHRSDFKVSPLEPGDPVNYAPGIWRLTRTDKEQADPYIDVGGAPFAVPSDDRPWYVVPLFSMIQVNLTLFMSFAAPGGAPFLVPVTFHGAASVPPSSNKFEVQCKSSSSDNWFALGQGVIIATLVFEAIDSDVHATFWSDRAFAMCILEYHRESLGKPSPEGWSLGVDADDLSGWEGLGIDVADQLAERLTPGRNFAALDPIPANWFCVGASKVHQRSANFCVAAAVVISQIRHDPVQFALRTVRLWRKGVLTLSLSPFSQSTPKSVRESPNECGVVELDWIWMISVRRMELSDATAKNVKEGQVDWDADNMLANLLGTGSSFQWALVTEWSELKKCGAKYGEGKPVLVAGNTNLFYKSDPKVKVKDPGIGWFGGHMVALAGDFSMYVDWWDDNWVKFSLFSWGNLYYNIKFDEVPVEDYLRDVIY